MKKLLCFIIFSFFSICVFSQSNDKQNLSKEDMRLLHCMNLKLDVTKTQMERFILKDSTIYQLITDPMERILVEVNDGDDNKLDLVKDEKGYILEVPKTNTYYINFSYSKLYNGTCCIYINTFLTDQKYPRF